MLYADIHRHLDGSLRPSTVAELAARQGLTVPPDLAFHAGMGLDQALSRFAFTLSLLQQPDAVTRVASEICEDAASEGVSTLELRFAPQLHGGGSIPEIVDAALDGIAGRAGLTLCLLYGQAPTVGDALLDAATAILDLGARRIGHGTTLLDDPEVLALVLDRQVTIEACPTSNWHVGAVPSVAAHPLPQWLERGVRACINTDNTLLSAVDAPEEYRRAASIPGMSPALLQQALAAGHAAAFQR